MQQWTVASLLAENEYLRDLLAEFAACTFPDGRDDQSIAISTMTGNVRVGAFRRARAAVQRLNPDDE